MKFSEILTSPAPIILVLYVISHQVLNSEGWMKFSETAHIP